MEQLQGIFSGRFGLFGKDKYLQEPERLAIIDFCGNIKDKEQVTPAHKELKERIDYLVGEYYDNIDEKEQPEVERFLKHYFDLFDDRSKREKIDALIEGRLRFLTGSIEGRTSERQRYYPSEYGKELPKKGAWVMLMIVLPIESKHRNNKYDIYYAVPKPERSRLGDGIIVPYYKVQVVINGQEVGVWPHEYVPYNISEVLEGVGTQWVLNRLGGTPNYDPAKVHYLGTRGVTQEQVYKMLMASIKSLNYCYFSLVPEAHEYFDHMIDGLQRGIRPEMLDLIWEKRLAAKPTADD
jgi:hypothetical protein